MAHLRYKAGHKLGLTDLPYNVNYRGKGRRKMKLANGPQAGSTSGAVPGTRQPFTHSRYGVCFVPMNGVKAAGNGLEQSFVSFAGEKNRAESIRLPGTAVWRDENAATADKARRLDARTATSAWTAASSSW